jgi:hypothetical protein
MFLFSKSPVKILWVLLTIAVTALIIFNSRIYFQHGPTPVFLLEKGSLRDWPLWRTAFYFHIVAACLCLAIGPILMVPAFLRFKRLHAAVGYLYINAVLWIAAPTGLMISPFAKGGWIAALGFLVTGVAWWISTWLGYRAIQSDDLASHIAWMVRSYAIALSAVWFRLIHLALAYSGMNALDSYVLSVWLSLAASIWVSEICIYRHFKKKAVGFDLSSISFPYQVKRGVS